MAKEYIEREAVIELFEEKQRAICPVGRCGHGYVYGRDRDEYDAIDSDIDKVENIPAADVAPVVRGRWTEEGFCSNCGCYMPTDDAHDAIFKDEVHYCYYCGAKMDVQDCLQNG